MKTKKPRNILVFCAHSDDQILGPGGTLARYAEEGRDVYTYIFSYGEASLPHYKRKFAAEARVNEAKKADEIIGGKGIVFFGLKDGKIKEEIESKKIVRKIKKIMLEKKPEKIFTHSPEDPHPDHKAVVSAVLSALDRSRMNIDVYSFSIWNIFTIRKSNVPRMYIDITRTMKKKMEALKAFRSQRIAILTLISNVVIKALINGTHLKNSRFAECFYKIR